MHKFIERQLKKKKGKNSPIVNLSQTHSRLKKATKPYPKERK